MASPAPDPQISDPQISGARRSNWPLRLAPLEADCMNVLWPMGEGTVREIRDQLAASRPRAYTTIMTIMNRLAEKGIVQRRKIGRAFLYRPNLSARDAGAHAIAQLAEKFFGGSIEALRSELNNFSSLPRLPEILERAPQWAWPSRTALPRDPATTKASRQARPRTARRASDARLAGALGHSPEDPIPATRASSVEPRIDETLL